MTDRSLRSIAARRALRTLFALPEPVMKRLAGPLPINDRGHALDLRTQAFIRTVALAREPVGSRGIAAMRHEMDHHAPLADFPRCALRRVQERMIPGECHFFRVRIYEPTLRDARPRPICMYFHGGGFVVGSVRSHDGLCSRIADRADVVVIAVEYRLAPEHPFPAAAEDAVCAFRWAVHHGAEFGADPHRIAVAGDSAGGNLAAVVAWHERHATPAPRFQLLIYPVTDYGEAGESRKRYASGFLHDEEAIQWFRSHYFDPQSAQRDNPMASIARAPDLSGIAPAHIVTAGFDPLRDDGEKYAARLSADGVPVTLVCEEQLVHGFFSLGGIIPSARAAVDRAIDALAAGVRR